MPRWTRQPVLCTLLVAGVVGFLPQTAWAAASTAAPKLWYTTYFYTATEAVVHGYEKDTTVKIVSLDKNKTVWSGKVNPGDTKLIPTGRGVFGFLSDKKASILVGTPSSCAVAGYFVRDEDGHQRSRRFYSALPSSVYDGDERVVAFAWEDIELTITDTTTDKMVFKGPVKKDAWHEIPFATLRGISGHTLHFAADKAALSVQVYYDQGFFVPSDKGPAAGKRFRSYVGKITSGPNHLNLISHRLDVPVTVTDVVSKKPLWSGVVKKGTVHTLSVDRKFVEVTAEKPILVSVSPTNFPGYAEHHFAAGLEGLGIDNEFLLSTPGEVWLFSYFDGNPVKVYDLDGKELFTTTLQAGHVHGLTPGAGTFRVVSDKGLSVMGGASSCGAEFSPAGGLFAVDEALFAVAETILEERRMRAQQEGRTFTAEDAAAPYSRAELSRAKSAVEGATGQSYSADEIEQRMKKLQESHD